MRSPGSASNRAASRSIHLGRALGFCLFDTAIGACALAWGEAALAGVQLPEASPEQTRRRMHRARGLGLGGKPRARLL